MVISISFHPSVSGSNPRGRIFFSFFLSLFWGGGGGWCNYFRKLIRSSKKKMWSSACVNRSLCTSSFSGSNWKKLLNKKEPWDILRHREVESWDSCFIRQLVTNNSRPRSLSPSKRIRGNLKRKNLLKWPVPAVRSADIGRPLFT